MNSKVDDRRVRKTKKVLREGLAQLMAKKNIQDISVRELTDLVDLHRGTFYLHYRDIYDLQQQIENEVIVEVELITQEYLPRKKGERPYALFVALLRYITENQGQCKMLLSANSSRTFLDKLSKLVEGKYLGNWLSDLRFQDAEKELPYLSGFLVYGYISIITRWVEQGMTDSPEDLALLMENMGAYGVGFLEKCDD